MNTLEQAKESLLNWIKHLESGQHLQTTGQLRHAAMNETRNMIVRDSFCCLGLYCKLNETSKSRFSPDSYDNESFQVNGKEYGFDSLPPYDFFYRRMGKVLGKALKKDCDGNQETADIYVNVPAEWSRRVLNASHPMLGGRYTVSSLNDFYNYTFKQIALVLRANFLPETLPEEQRFDG